MPLIANFIFFILWSKSSLRYHYLNGVRLAFPVNNCSQCNFDSISAAWSVESSHRSEGFCFVKKGSVREKGREEGSTCFPLLMHFGQSLLEFSCETLCIHMAVSYTPWHTFGNLQQNSSGQTGQCRLLIANYLYPLNPRIPYLDRTRIQFGGQFGGRLASSSSDRPSPTEPLRWCTTCPLTDLANLLAASS